MAVLLACSCRHRLSDHLLVPFVECSALENTNDLLRYAARGGQRTPATPGHRSR